MTAEIHINKKKFPQSTVVGQRITNRIHDADHDGQIPIFVRKSWPIAARFSSNSKTNFGQFDTGLIIYSRIRDRDSR
jgi:hypothetical protein